ncbi:MAG: alanine--tRNA ligase [Candidatus Paceibacterota bacterium]|jgi:alanyl-tRNA synthetase
MQSDEIRLKFLKFFENRGHKIIPSASLVPENDPSVLFNTAGMQPLVPYLLGEVHPMGNRLVNVQKCVRTGDLDDIGDNRHFSFFEMLGNWSLGDYFKEDAIKWSYEFLTSKEEGLGLDTNRLYFTIFEGDENAPFDQESKDIWMSMGISENRIYALPADDNWWSPGDNGPCGPCSEMFYDMSGVVGDLSKEEFLGAVKKEDVIEIWNDVFMEFEKKDGKVIGKLKQKNVDTGAGLERITAVMQGKKTAYDTDLFSDISAVLISVGQDIGKKRIIADHIRASVFLISDGVIPSNKDQGYVLRRLIRRAIFCFSEHKMKDAEVSSLVDVIVIKYGNIYKNIKEKSEYIKNVIKDESNKFNQTILQGLKEFEKGTDPFILSTTYGFPVELTEELAKEKGIVIDRDDFDKKMTEHQKLSQTASAGMFKGGLADSGEEAKKLHTATHLLNAALKQVLGNHVMQKGSNITGERLRFDFTHIQKMTEEEKKKVEEIVNDKIAEKLSVSFVEMPKADAEKIAAHSFNEKYGEVVKVYSVGDEKTGYFSREFCGGPHVSNTGELGKFKIQKEEAVAHGIRRIKAVLF